MNDMKPISGWEGIYSVSRCGKIWSHRSAKWLKANQTSTGYLKVNLCKLPRRLNRKVHRLVALAFLGGGLGRDVDHIDGDRHNNRVENLRWATRSQNLANSKASNGPKGIEKNGSGWCARITVEGKRLYLGTFRTQREASEAYDKQALRSFGSFARTNAMEMKGEIKF